MGEPSKAIVPHSEHYRELASKLRGIARQSRLPGTREKILNLASWYEVRSIFYSNPAATLRNQLIFRNAPGILGIIVVPQNRSFSLEFSG